MAMKRRAQKDGGLAISPRCAPPPPALCHPAPRTKPADDLQRCGDLPTGHLLDGKESHHTASSSETLSHRVSWELEYRAVPGWAHQPGLPPFLLWPFDWWYLPLDWL